MKFLKRLLFGLISTTALAAHVKDRSIYATDIINAQGTSVYQFPTTLPTANQLGILNANGESTSLGSFGTAGQPLLSGGSSSLPSWATLGVNGGGTGFTSATANHLLAGNGTSALQVVSSLGTTTTLLHGNASGLPTFSGVNFGTDGVSGTYLPLLNGGGGFTNSESTLNLSSGGIPSPPWNNFPISNYSNYITVSQVPSNYNISGMVPNGGLGQQVTFYNNGINNLWFGGSGSSGHSFCPIGGGTYFYLVPHSSVTWQYEYSNDCWFNTTPGQIDQGNYPGLPSYADVTYWNAKQNYIPWPPEGSIVYSFGGGPAGSVSQMYFDPYNYYINFNNSGAEVPAGLYIGPPTPFTLGNVGSGGMNPVNTADGFNPPSFQSINFNEVGSGYGPANGTTYEYGLSSCIQVENICFGTTGGDTGPQTDPNDGSFFQIQLFYADAGSSQTIVTAESGATGGPQLVGNGGGQPFTDPGGLTNNTPSGGFQSASSTYIQATGSSALTETLTVYAYNGSLYSPTGYTINGNDPGDSGFYVGDYSWSSVSGAVSYYVIASGPAGNGSFTTTNTFYVLTSSSSFSGSTTPPSPTSSPVPAIEAAGFYQGFQLPVQPSGVAPSSPVAGSFGLTSGFLLCVYNGSGWVNSGTGLTCTF